MPATLWQWIAYAVLALLALCGATGCQGMKTVDSTQAALAALHSGQSGPIEIPLEDGRTVTFTTLPGKDVLYEEYYPDGQIKRRVQTTRSKIIEVALAAIAGIDVDKLQHDELMLQQAMAFVQAYIPPQLVQSALAQRLAPPGPPPATGGSNQAPGGGGAGQIAELIAELRALKQAVAELRAGAGG